MEVARYVQNIQNKKLVILLQYDKKKLLLFSIVMQNIQIFYVGPVMFVIGYFLWY